MKAAVFSAPGQLDIVERDIPEVEPGWVRLAVTNVGICGSDLHFYRDMLGDVTGRQPGHEVAGIIDATGDGVRWDTGIFVALEPLTSCGHCVQCQTGYYNRCPDLRILGGSAPGGMAQYMTVPAERLYPFPGEVAPYIAALSEPMAVGVRGIRVGA